MPHRAATQATPANTRLVERLTDPAAFDDAVGTVQRIETHISWVLLTRRHAYKIKKALVLDFLDFGDLERRRFYCEEEIRLNRPWAPDIYIDVVAITEQGGQPRFGGDGEPVEYAVRMHRFGEHLRLDHQLSAGRLSADDMRELGQAVADRHDGAPAAAPGTRERVLHMTSALMRDNFATLEGHADAATLTTLLEWTEAGLRSAEDLIGQRFDQGFVRDCHGDLHLGNLVRMPGGIRTFDCIEFSDDLRRIDVMCDTAFLVMDLVAKGHGELAAQFLNRYLERCGDYAGVAVLDLFFVYRSLVRAKVAALRSRECAPQAERQEHLAAADRYCRIALRKTCKAAPLLIVMHGLSGSGKTWVSGRLMALLPAIRVRSDVERKRLFGRAETARTEAPIEGGIYTPRSSQAVYEHICRTAQTVLATGHNVIVDATFLRREQRERALAVADGCGCRAVIVSVTAAPEVMRERILRREQGADEVSEASLQVLENQLATGEDFTTQERQRVIEFENRAGADIGCLLDAIRQGTA